MVSKIWVINIFLALIVAFVALRAYGVWSEENVAPKTDKSTKVPLKGSKKPVKIFGERRVLPEPEYSVVVTKNLFAPGRTEASPAEKTPVEKKQTFTIAQLKELDQQLKKMTLYGLIITDDSAKALVTDVAYKTIFKKGRTIRQLNVKKTKWVKPGDSLGDFKVAEIKNDRVFLMAEKKTYELLLYDKKKSKHRRPAKPKTGPTVVGVSVNPQLSTIDRVKAIVPLTDKKRTAVKAPPGATLPLTQGNLKKAIDKKQVR